MAGAAAAAGDGSYVALFGGQGSPYVDNLRQEASSGSPVPGFLTACNYGLLEVRGHCKEGSLPSPGVATGVLHAPFSLLAGSPPISHIHLFTLQELDSMPTDLLLFAMSTLPTLAQLQQDEAASDFPISAASASSLPLVYIAQMANFINGEHGAPEVLLDKMSHAIGHSQGLLAAMAVSASTTLDELLDISR